ncbi:hypothetical protein HU200_008919 [Digitaria exilis]|uniref:DUF1618 domain-containing protein n=1 Tax=Digitaria exilis TaxID=1010633 RepID=A0A835FN90_9POAL|nr:hypothetical protein HU200_008919 [Digitaria exilis]
MSAPHHLGIRARVSAAQSKSDRTAPFSGAVTMDDEYVACLDPPLIPTEDCSNLSLSSVILDTTAYISADAVFNPTTAVGELSTGALIQVSFCTARPPRLSYLCVHFPGPVLGPDVATVFGPVAGTPAVRCVRDPPLVISTHADRALLRVSIPGSLRVNDHNAFDYFVYTARRRPGSCLLHRLPKPYGLPRFRDQDASIVSCSGTRYVIAVLRNTLSPMEFTLQLYDSDTRRWTSRNLPVHLEPERDMDLPIPDSDADLFFHDTTKAIALESTTVGWVDLWRGILFCNVLDEKPVLRDMPLPKPARCSRGSYRGDPYVQRDISVVALPGQPQMNLIQYVQMGTRVVRSSRWQPVEHSTSGSSSDEHYDVDCYWTATIWTMPVPIASWKDWRKDCTIDVANIVIDNPRHSELLLNALPNPGFT